MVSSRWASGSPPNSTLTAYPDVAATTNPGPVSVKFRKVMPKWSYKSAQSQVAVTNYSRYGQRLRLQKRANGTWKTVRSVTVTSGTTSWTAKTGRGTWRLSSVSNTKMAVRVSCSWRS